MGNIVLVGAGGTGMSGVAGLLFDLGFDNIVCVDGHQSQLTDKLTAMGLEVVIGHGKYDVQESDIVIYSAAAESSPEVQTAFAYPYDGKFLRIVWNYFQFLGELSKYFSTIAIVGTNGKSSTTALGLYAARDLLPNFGIGILGALVSGFDEKNYIIGDDSRGQDLSKRADIKSIFDSIFSKQELKDTQLIKKYIFMLEACEYKRHFLTLDVDHAVLTSLGCDHLDYFEDEADYLSAFGEFFAKVKGKIFILEGEAKKLEWESVLGQDYVDKKLFLVEKKNFQFDHIFGQWNHWNASLLSGLFFNVFSVRPQDFADKIKGSSGLWRRMELLGNLPGGALVYSDYGHMAEPILMGYQALLKQYPDKNIVVCFQPHQLRRVVTERDQFIDALSRYKQCYIYDIYAARESVDDYKDFVGFQDLKDLNVQSVGHLFAGSCGGTYFEDFDVLREELCSLSDDYVLVVYSAGDIDYLLRQKIT